MAEKVSYSLLYMIQCTAELMGQIITLGKKGNDPARRAAMAFLMVRNLSHLLYTPICSSSLGPPPGKWEQRIQLTVSLATRTTLQNAPRAPYRLLDHPAIPHLHLHLHPRLHPHPRRKIPKHSNHPQPSSPNYSPPSLSGTPPDQAGTRVYTGSAGGRATMPRMRSSSSSMGPKISNSRWSAGRWGARRRWLVFRWRAAGQRVE